MNKFGSRSDDSSNSDNPNTNQPNNPSFQESGDRVLSQEADFQRPQLKVDAPLRMVETAFFASTGCLIWFIDFYLRLGPLLRIFYPIPIALVYLRWGKRAAWMAAVVSGLLVSVLMGPVRSILFVMPFGFMGVLLGATWRRRVPWAVSVTLGALLGSLGFFFQVWLLSVIAGEDLWVYVINQVTEFVEWILPFLAPFIPTLAFVSVILQNFLYLFVVHLAAWLLLDRLGNPIPRPPRWVQVLMDYE